MPDWWWLIGLIVLVLLRTSEVFLPRLVVTSLTKVSSSTARSDSLSFACLCQYWQGICETKQCLDYIEEKLLAQGCGSKDQQDSKCILVHIHTSVRNVSNTSLSGLLLREPQQRDERAAGCRPLTWSCRKTLLLESTGLCFLVLELKDKQTWKKHRAMYLFNILLWQCWMMGIMSM